MALEVSITVECGHAASAGGGDCLSIDMVHDIASSKNPGDAGLGCIARCASFCLQIAIFHLQLIGEQGRVRAVANGYEDPGQGNIFRRICFGMFDSHPVYTGVVPKYFIQFVGTTPV